MGDYEDDPVYQEMLATAIGCAVAVPLAMGLILLISAYGMGY